jgi:hypothetical protein
MRTRILSIQHFGMVILCLAAAGCGSTGDKVLQDFGIKDRPEDYVSGADRVMVTMQEVGKVEMDRLNAAQRRGEVQYDNSDPLHGRYFRRVRVYESYHPLDANAATRTSQNQPVSFIGYMEYAFQVYESERVETRTEAATLAADIPTGRRGRETYRYKFDSAGTWNGARGESFKE